ncbi:zinc-binding dehydrogenase, partial [Rhizobium wenxiniae]|uniref:zinc-binding dehydrogenase n=1 Tax=Rhizobium wenxiniae TaxID=1737357 RepID=UPI003C17BB6D
GSTAIVFGLGGIGLNVLQGLRLAGAEMIIGVDINPDRKEWGEKFGMTHFVTGRNWMGTAFGGARGRTDVPKIVDWYMEGKIQIDPMITHTMPLEDINKGFDLMHKGESIRGVVVY